MLHPCRPLRANFRNLLFEQATSTNINQQSPQKTELTFAKPALRGLEVRLCNLCKLRASFLIPRDLGVHRIFLHCFWRNQKCFGQGKVEKKRMKHTIKLIFGMASQTSKTNIETGNPCYSNEPPNEASLKGLSFPRIYEKYTKPRKSKKQQVCLYAVHLQEKPCLTVAAFESVFLFGGKLKYQKNTS